MLFTLNWEVYRNSEIYRCLFTVLLTLTFCAAYLKPKLWK